MRDAAPSAVHARESYPILNEVPWQWMPAAAAITAMVLGVNFIGDGLRDALDPKTAKRG